MSGRSAALAIPFTVTSGVLATPAILAATLLWGMSTSAAKLALDDWPPISQAWLRFAVALVVLIPLVRLMSGRLALGRMPALLGVIGVGLFYAVHNLGLHATSAMNASLILDGGTPALTILFGAMLLGERPRRRPAIGLLLSLLGVGIVVLAKESGRIGEVGHGDLLMILSAALWALYSIVGKQIFRTEGVLPVVAGSTLYGTVLLSPPAVFELTQIGIPAITLQGAGLLLFLGVGCSAIAYLFLGHALIHLTAWKVASWTTIMPLVGVIAAVAFLREEMALGQAAGGALILAGVALATIADSAGSPDPTGDAPSAARPSNPQPGEVDARPDPSAVTAAETSCLRQPREGAPSLPPQDAIVWPSPPSRKSSRCAGSRSPAPPEWPQGHGVG